jgi:hypothetical protein
MMSDVLTSRSTTNIYGQYAYSIYNTVLLRVNIKYEIDYPSEGDHNPSSLINYVQHIQVV